MLGNLIVSTGCLLQKLVNLKKSEQQINTQIMTAGLSTAGSNQDHHHLENHKNVF